MKKILLNIKINKDLKEFKQFKASYNFKSKKIIENEDGSVFCDGICLREGNNSPLLGETDKLVNVGYNIKNTLSRIISN